MTSANFQHLAGMGMGMGNSYASMSGGAMFPGGGGGAGGYGGPQPGPGVSAGAMPRAAINFNDGLGGGDDVTRNLLFNTCRESGDHGA